MRHTPHTTETYTIEAGNITIVYFFSAEANCRELTVSLSTVEDYYKKLELDEEQTFEEYLADTLFADQLNFFNMFLDYSRFAKGNVFGGTQAAIISICKSFKTAS